MNELLDSVSEVIDSHYLSEFGVEVEGVIAFGGFEIVVPCMV